MDLQRPTNAANVANYKVFPLLILVHLITADLNCDKNNQHKNIHCNTVKEKPLTLMELSQEGKHVFKDNEKPILLWWYEDAFPQSTSEKSHEIQCSLGSCIISVDRSNKDHALTRALVFYGTSFLANDLPLPRKQFHLWALIHEESPKNNWIFSHQDAISMFNYTATFRRESNYPLTTQFIVDPNDWTTPKYFVSTEEKNRLQKTLNLAPVVYLQRDCNPPSDRDNYIRMLMKFIRIDSYGPCLNNKQMPANIDGFHKFQDEENYKFLSKYKFHLSFENAICKDYMTEKLFRPLEIGVVPVYRGSAFARDFMPNNQSAIFADDFKTPEDLAKYLKELDANDGKYDAYFAHHKSGITNKLLLNTVKTRKWRIHGEHDKVNFIYRMYAGFACELCDFIINRNRRLKDHIRDPSIKPPPVSIGSSNDMGCPEPIRSVDDRSNVNKSVCFWEGLHEAKALKEMLLSNESDSKNFVPRYLKRRTDKYSFL